MQQMLLGTSGRITYATWNPADKSTNVVLSNGNLTFAISTATNSMARSTISKSSGKWYWEVTAATTPRIGIATSAASLNVALGSEASSWAWYGAVGTIINNNTTLATVTTLTTGDIIGFALDVGTGTLSFYKNNVFAYTATGIPTGMFAAISASGATSGGTAKFGATTLTYTPPSGFNAGLYV